MSTFHSKVARFWRNSGWVKAQVGKSRLVQLMEAVQLRFGPGRVGLSDYFDMRLFDPAYFSRTERLKFAGTEKQGAIDRELNDPHWRSYANDKLLFTLILKAVGLPVIPIYAIYSEIDRWAPGVETISGIDQLADYLSKRAQYPLFSKPSDSCGGHYAMSILGYDEHQAQLQLSSGVTLPIEKFHREIVHEDPFGYLFQPCIVSHREIRRIVGERVSTIRCVIRADQGTPRIYLGLWRLPCGKAMCDNFNRGCDGNMLVHPDIATGRAAFAIRRLGRDMVRETVHPDTGVSLKDFEIPRWREACELSLKGAKLFPGLKLQHWDIAVTDDGVMAMELNVNGGMSIWQVAVGRGML